MNLVPLIVREEMDFINPKYSNENIREYRF
jgi:hypothetical protein